MVTIYVLADAARRPSSGVGAPPNLIAAVNAAVTAPDARQQTDKVRVRAAQLVEWDIDVTLTLRSPQSSDLTVARANAALEALGAASSVIGGGVPYELLAAAAVQPAVQSAAIVVWRHAQPVAATATIGNLLSPGRVVFAARDAGAAGNTIRVTCVGVSPRSPMRATVSGRVVRVDYTPNATAAQWVSTIATSTAAAALVTATVGFAGAVTCAGQDSKLLTGGVDATRAKLPARTGIESAVGVAPVAGDLSVRAA